MKKLILFSLFLFSTFAHAEYYFTGSGNATALQGTPVSPTAPSGTQCLVSTAGVWGPGSCSGSSGIAGSWSTTGNVVTTNGVDTAQDSGTAFTSICTLTGTQALTNKTVDGVTPTVFGYLDPTSSVQTQLNGKAPADHINAFGNSGATPTIDFSTGNSQTVTLTSNAVFSLTNGVAGRAYVVRILGGSGGFSIAMNNVTWLNATAGGSPPGAPTAGAQVDVSLLCVDGTNYDGSFTGNY